LTIFSKQESTRTGESYIGIFERIERIRVESDDGMAFPESWLNELLSKNDIVCRRLVLRGAKTEGQALGACAPYTGKDRLVLRFAGKHSTIASAANSGGSVIQYIMDASTCTLPEAWSTSRTAPARQSPEEVNDAAMQRERAKRERLSEACKIAARFYMENAWLWRAGPPGTRVFEKARHHERVGQAIWHRLRAPSEGKRSRATLGEKGIFAGGTRGRGVSAREKRQSGRTYDAYRGRCSFQSSTPAAGWSGCGGHAC
jgi:hypothetical protein